MLYNENNTMNKDNTYQSICIKTNKNIKTRKFLAFHWADCKDVTFFLFFQCQEILFLVFTAHNSTMEK